MIYYLIDNQYHLGAKQKQNSVNKFKNNNQVKGAGISEFNILILINLAELYKKKVEVCFTLEETSNDGGLLLLREVYKHIAIINRLTYCIRDNRHQGYVKNSAKSMLSQSVIQIVAGYEDTNDCKILKDDGILKVCAGQQQSLATQPTMCRLENQPGKMKLYCMAKAFLDHLIASYESTPGIIIIDSDDKDSLTYGQQELALFNIYYGDNCHMTWHKYEGFSGKLITTILKPGYRSKSVNAFVIHKRIIVYLPGHWPQTMIILRGDSHFCSKQLTDWTHELKNIEFLTGLTCKSLPYKCTRVTEESAKSEYGKSGNLVKSPKIMATQSKYEATNHWQSIPENMLLAKGMIA